MRNASPPTRLTDVICPQGLFFSPTNTCLAFSHLRTNYLSRPLLTYIPPLMGFAPLIKDPFYLKMSKILLKVKETKSGELKIQKYSGEGPPDPQHYTFTTYMVRGFGYLFTT